MSAPISRRLVLCLDGTWNSPYDLKKRESGEEVLKPSNVLKMCRSVRPRDDREPTILQVSYYDIGVGSLSRYPGFANKLLYRSDRILGGAWGGGFEGNVEDALHFLALNYEAGDEVFIFGFSRGAATARTVTKVIDWLGGLPPKRDAYYLPILFRKFVESRGEIPSRRFVEEINTKRLREDRREIAPMQPVSVKFLGVWDTVFALGSRFRATGGDTNSGKRSYLIDSVPASCVTHARQALAIDEARFDFRPAIWKGRTHQQTLKQRWFPGVHSNVGGGYVDDGLANSAFQWMRREAEVAGLSVDGDFADRFPGFAQDRLYRSENLMYRALDAFRNRYGRGRRDLSLEGTQAGLELDVSAVWRVQAEPHEKGAANNSLRFPEMKGRPYRPENVLRYLAVEGGGEPEMFLKSLDPPPRSTDLPTDVLRRLAKIRTQEGGRGVKKPQRG